MKTNLKHILGKIFGIITDILLIASLTILVLSAYTAHQYKEDPDNAYLFGYKPILVLTGSMEPTMRVNAICVAQKIPYEEVKVDDIIMFQIDDKLITHRVIEITDMGIRTKGDNNNAEDAYYLKENNVKAKVVYIANWTATIIDDLQTTQGKIKWIGFPIFVLVVLFILSRVIKKILNSPDEEEENDTPNNENIEPVSEITENIEIPKDKQEEAPTIVENDE